MLYAFDLLELDGEDLRGLPLGYGEGGQPRAVRRRKPRPNGQRFPKSKQKGPAEAGPAWYFWSEARCWLQRAEAISCAIP
jgi:hypothetical protein